MREGGLFVGERSRGGEICPCSFGAVKKTEDIYKCYSFFLNLGVGSKLEPVEVRIILRKSA